MQNFTSDISKTNLPVCEKVSGKAVRNGVLKEIQKEFLHFDDARLCQKRLYGKPEKRTGNTDAARKNRPFTDYTGRKFTGDTKKLKWT